MKKLLIILFIVICIPILIVVVQLSREGFIKTVTPREKPKIDFNKQCDSDYVIVEMDGVYIKLPREGHIWNVITNGMNYGISDRKHCDINLLKSVTEVGSAGFRLNVIPNKEKFINEFVRHTISRFDENHKETLENGTIKLDNGNTQIYLIHSEILKTYNGDPIFLNCHGREEDRYGPHPILRSCKASYIHPIGLGFSHKIPGRKYSESDFLNVVREKHQRLQSMIVNSPNQRD
uniref:Uncharacterized protein n=1 Tax=Roseihalotalea indica TaxID=2867963 RepID=A0AA49GGR4_9BACT|nr:hypothetical protein K4G66_18425 [Tunicatimonas sp. TK19036]